MILFPFLKEILLADDFLQLQRFCTTVSEAILTIMPKRHVGRRLPGVDSKHCNNYFGHHLCQMKWLADAFTIEVYLLCNRIVLVVTTGN
jgi:hypothetical protein